MNTRDIAKLFGGQTALARLVGIQQSAIAYWVKSNSIPSKWHAQLLDLASSHGVDLQAADLIQGGVDALIINNRQGADDVLASVVERNAPGLDTMPASNSHFLFYASSDGTVKVQVVVGNETVWASQKGMAEIFGVDVRTINEHLQNIFKSGELEESTVIRNFRITVDSCQLSPLARKASFSPAHTLSCVRRAFLRWGVKFGLGDFGRTYAKNRYFEGCM